MKKFNISLAKIAQRTLVIMLNGVLTVLLFFILGHYFAIIQESIAPLVLFDTSLTGYSYETAIAIVQALGEQEKNIYTYIVFPLDILFPLAYSLFFWGLVLKFAAGLNKYIPAISTTLVWLVFSFDILENSLVQLILHGYNERWVIQLASCATQAKWIGLLVILCGILLLGCVQLGTKIQSKWKMNGK